MPQRFLTLFLALLTAWSAWGGIELPPAQVGDVEIAVWACEDIQAGQAAGSVAEHQLDDQPTHGDERAGGPDCIPTAIVRTPLLAGAGHSVPAFISAAFPAPTPKRLQEPPRG